MTSVRTDLVTGGAGFIGRELVDLLVKAGRRVIVFDDLSTARWDHRQWTRPDGVELVVGDVRDPEALRDCIRDSDTVYHLAVASLRRSIPHPDEVHDINATGTLTVLRAARDAQVRRVVHVSSSEVYGSARHVPMDESHPTEPTTPYGASKLAGEAYARAFHLTYRLPVVIVRPFNVFGRDDHHERDCGELIPRFVLSALAGTPLAIFGDGQQTRDFTPVRFTAAAIHAAGTTPGIEGRTFNLGTGVEVSVLEVADAILRLVGTTGPGIEHGPARPGDVRRLCADASLARSMLGFAPSCELDNGILALAERYRADPRGIAALVSEMQ